MKIVDIAQEIYLELGQPADLSIAAISYWLRSNIGVLNNKINKDIIIDDSNLELDPSLGEAEKSIYKKIYDCYYYDLKLKQTLGAVSIDSVLEVTDGGGRVMKLNKNETSKIYLQAKKDSVQELEMMVSSYKINDVGPLQVAGDDTVAGMYSKDWFRVRNRFD